MSILKNLDAKEFLKLASNFDSEYFSEDVLHPRQVAQILERFPELKVSVNTEISENDNQIEDILIDSIVLEGDQKLLEVIRNTIEVFGLYYRPHLTNNKLEITQY